LHALVTQLIPPAFFTPLLQLFVHVPHFVTSVAVRVSHPTVSVAQWL
jgi:hypothetical protein